MGKKDLQNSGATANSGIHNKNLRNLEHLDASGLMEHFKKKYQKTQPLR